MSEKTPTELKGVLDRAIFYCAKFVPVEHRMPTSGGGPVLSTAVAMLVAARALVEALVEYDEKAASAAKTAEKSG
jgi:hypothetical protein